MQTSFADKNIEKITPPEEFIKQANISNSDIYDQFEENWTEGWETVADFLDWKRDYDSVIEPTDSPPYYEWFVGGELNATENCIDRHVREGRSDDPALRWIGMCGDTKEYTYGSLQTEVNEVAAMLRGLGVSQDDPVALYLPRIPELPITMLACARIGAPHVVIAAEYSADIVTSFMRETGAKTIVTCEGYHENSGNRSLAEKATESANCINCDITKIVVSKFNRQEKSERGYDYRTHKQKHQGKTVEPVSRASEDPLFICYASGPSGEQIGMKHGTGGYLSYVAWTSYAALDIKPEDTVWCPAGMEWITGHSYAIYGPLIHGATTIFYEGSPASSDKHRPWKIIEENGVSQFYTTPTAIRTFMNWGPAYPNSYDLSSLRLLGTVGQRIDPESWKWFYKHIGKQKCPIVDTWYQAETGGITISTLPAICDMKPGSAGVPLPGIDATVVDADGSEVSTGESGYLVLTRPCPGFFRPVQTANQTVQEYWTGFSDINESWVYFSEDGAVVDEDGYFKILGRLDGVINIGYDSKTRVHTSEIERVIDNVDGIDEVAVIRGHHGIKGEAPYAFVVPSDPNSSEIQSQVVDNVRQNLAIHACPEEVYTVPELPRTYSGGVLKKVLEDLLNKDRLGNTDLIRNPDVLDQIAVEIRHRS